MEQYPTPIVNSEILPPSSYFLPVETRHSIIYSSSIPRPLPHFSTIYIKTHTFMECNSKIPRYLSTELWNRKTALTWIKATITDDHQFFVVVVVVFLFWFFFFAVVLSYKVILLFLWGRVMFCFPIHQYIYQILYKVVDCQKNIYFFLKCWLSTFSLRSSSVLLWRHVMAF